MDSHLAGPQHLLPLTRRRQTRKEISAWSNLFQAEADLTRLEIPVHPLPRRSEELDWYDDGRKCHLRRHIVRTDEWIKKHYRTEHGLENEWKRGRKTADRPAEDDETPQTAESNWNQARSQLTQSWAGVQTAQERAIRERRPGEVNPWLERAGWEPYLAGLDNK